MLVGCEHALPASSSPKTFIDALDDEVIAHFSGRNKGIKGSSGITVKQGQYLVVDDQLTKGQVRVSISREDGSGETTDYILVENGGVRGYYMISPSDYMVSFTVEEAASGEIHVKTEEKKKDDSAAAEASAVRDGGMTDILGADFFETDEGEPAVRVRIRYTNNADMPAYMLETFDILAYQGDTPLEDISESPETQPLFREVGSGKSVTGSYVFMLYDDEAVDVRICAAEKNTDVLAGKTFHK